MSPYLLDLQKIKGIELSNGEIPDIYFIIILNTLNNNGVERINIAQQITNIDHQLTNTDTNIIQKQLSDLFEPYLEKLKTEMAIIDKNMSLIDAFFKWYAWENGKKYAYELFSEVINPKTK